jgi:transposase
MVLGDGRTFGRNRPVVRGRLHRHRPDRRFTSNEAERGVRPVKVQQRTSGDCWRTLQGLADFEVVQSYLSTATKWGIEALDALTLLFTTGPWLRAAIRPG